MLRATAKNVLFGIIQRDIGHLLNTFEHLTEPAALCFHNFPSAVRCQRLGN